MNEVSQRIREREGKGLQANVKKKKENLRKHATFEEV